MAASQAEKSPAQNKPKFDNAGLRVMLRETILGFVFWSLFQGLAPMIWFYPLNELEISGYEAFAVFFMSPLILVISPLRRLLQHPFCMAILRLISLACLGSFQAPTTLHRLVILAGGVGAVSLVQALSLWHQSPYQRSISFWGLILGLFAFLSSRVWFTSFVPTWWSFETNSAVIAIGAIATLDKIFSGDQSLPSEDIKPVLRPLCLLSGVGLGSLIFITNWVFGEVSLVTRWTVTGFPDTGPMPYPWGAGVLIALYFGACLSPCKHVSNSFIWWLIGCGGFAALYFLNTWQAYAGGLVLAVYTMSIWPVVVDRATAGSPAILGVAALVYVAEVLFSVWTVAYNFVPGGVYTREHTDWLIAFVMVMLGLLLFLPRNRPTYKSNTSLVQLGRTKMPNSATNILLFVLFLAGLGGFAARYPRQTFTARPVQHPKADFTAAIWTYHFGYDNKGWPSLERTAQLLNNTGADVITLLESDASKPFLGNNDLGMWLGERLGMYVDFGASTRDHTWGNLILSKYPIVKSTHHLLPSPHGELAPGITATVNMSGLLVDFVVTHMGNDRDVLDRELQAKKLAQELRDAANPVVFMGYVTSSPGSRDYKHLTAQGNVLDIDATDSERWCEYIMYRGLQKLGYARVSHGGLSDTEVQMAKFRIPEDAANFEDNTRIEKNPEKVDDDVLFPEVFGKYRAGHNWVHKHWYHMSTPKYFVRK